MHLKTYFFALTPDDRKVFAEKVGTSVGHLNNVAYGYTSLSPVASVAVERESDKAVTRQELHPDDYWLIWPELGTPSRKARIKPAPAAHQSSTGIQ